VAKRFPAVHVREVHFYKGKADSGEGVADRHARVGECTGVDDQEIGTVQLRALDPIDQRALVVALEKDHFCTTSPRNFG
jgi:hypothetical protein